VHADPVDPMPTHEDHALLRELTAETSTPSSRHAVQGRTRRRRSSSFYCWVAPWPASRSPAARSAIANAALAL
jgi:hypothetical protein